MNVSRISAASAAYEVNVGQELELAVKWLEENNLEKLLEFCQKRLEPGSGRMSETTRVNLLIAKGFCHLKLDSAQAALLNFDEALSVGLEHATMPILELIGLLALAKMEKIGSEIADETIDYGFKLDQWEKLRSVFARLEREKTDEPLGPEYFVVYCDYILSTIQKDYGRALVYSRRLLDNELTTPEAQLGCLSTQIICSYQLNDTRHQLPFVLDLLNHIEKMDQNDRHCWVFNENGRGLLTLILTKMDLELSLEQLFFCILIQIEAGIDLDFCVNSTLIACEKLMKGRRFEDALKLSLLFFENPEIDLRLMSSDNALELASTYCACCIGLGKWNEPLKAYERVKQVVGLADYDESWSEYRGILEMHRVVALCKLRKFEEIFSLFPNPGILERWPIRSRLQAASGLIFAYGKLKRFDHISAAFACVESQMFGAPNLLNDLIYSQIFALYKLGGMSKIFNFMRSCRLRYTAENYAILVNIAHNCLVECGERRLAVTLVKEFS